MSPTERTRIKICGLTRAADLDAAIAAGTDAVGLVFCPRSPRHLQAAQARALCARIPAFVSVVALFLDPPVELVQEVLDAVSPELLQFHGGESADFCRQFGRRYLKAIAMGEGADPQAQVAAHPDACAYLLDSHAPGGHGGSGEAFDWRRAPGAVANLVLAGGLSPSNVEAAVRQLRPWAVDVSSGVEDAPGCKSAAKMADFIRAVRRADAASAGHPDEP